MQSSANGEAGTGKLKGIVVIECLNSLGYLYALFPVLRVASFFWLGDIFVLYFMLGLFCSLMLFKHRRWSWFLAMIMWIGEGIFILWASLTTSLYVFFIPVFLLAYPVNLLVFLSVGVFRFASVVYFATKRVRRAFAVDLRRQPIEYFRSFRVGSEYKGGQD